MKWDLYASFHSDVSIALTRACDKLCPKLSIILGLMVSSLPLECFIAYAETQEVYNRSHPPPPSADSTPGNAQADPELGTRRHGDGAGWPVVSNRHPASSCLSTLH